MRKALVIVALVIAPAPALSQSETDIRQIASAAVQYLQAAWICREPLGSDAHYQAARTIVVSTFEQVATPNEAVLVVENIEQRMRDEGGSFPSLEPLDLQNACLSDINDRLFDLQVAKANAGLR